jgi:thiol-disulfide isomerase/thioredoxin
MNKTCFLLIILLLPSLIFAQNEFRIEIVAPSFNNDSILFSPSFIRRGFEEFYNFKLNTNPSIIRYGEKFGLKSSIFQLRIQAKNILKGQFDYPQPVSFQYVELKTKQVYLSSSFFLDTGYYKIELPGMFDSYDVSLNSPVNNEYSNFKKVFSDLYLKPKNKSRFDSLIDLNKKEERIGSYIKKHPNSYVALWEIINDYTNYNFNSIYITNLQLFSAVIKKSILFKKFENKLKMEAMTKIGDEFPTIDFGKQGLLTRKDFRKYNLTFIDYWTTTCLPCIKSMPQIVEMQKEYKDKGINFITVTDENEKKRMELAKSILTRNNVKWTNYFDINKDFRNKVNATIYPLQFLVNRDGRIVARASGDLSEIKKIIDESLK